MSRAAATGEDRCRPARSTAALFAGKPPWTPEELRAAPRRPNPDYARPKRGQIVGASLERTKRGIAIYTYIAQGGNRMPKRRRLSDKETRKLLAS